MTNIQKLETAIRHALPELMELTEGCDIVVKFTDDIVYYQFSDNCPNVITSDELQEIVDFGKKGFVESDFENVKPT